MVEQSDPPQDADGSSIVTAKRGFRQAPIYDDASSDQTAASACKKAKTSKTPSASRLSAATREVGHSGAASMRSLILTLPITPDTSLWPAGGI